MKDVSCVFLWLVCLGWLIIWGLVLGVLFLWHRGRRNVGLA